MTSSDHAIIPQHNQVYIIIAGQQSDNITLSCSLKTTETLLVDMYI